MRKNSLSSLSFHNTRRVITPQQNDGVLKAERALDPKEQREVSCPYKFWGWEVNSIPCNPACLGQEGTGEGLASTEGHPGSEQHWAGSALDCGFKEKEMTQLGAAKSQHCVSYQLLREGGCRGLEVGSLTLGSGHNLRVCNLTLVKILCGRFSIFPTNRTQTASHYSQLPAFTGWRILWHLDCHLRKLLYPFKRPGPDLQQNSLLSIMNTISLGVSKVFSVSSSLKIHYLILLRIPQMCKIIFTSNHPKAWLLAAKCKMG